MREISSESQNLNWVAHWLLSPPQGINAVTVNLIGCIEELSPHEINKPVAMFITNNIIPRYNSEISAFMFPFGGVAKQSAAKLRNNWSDIRQLNQRCSRKKLCLNFSYQSTYFEWMWWFPAVLCLAELSSVVLRCLHDVHDVEISRIVPWVQTGFFSFSLIPDSSRRGWFAKKFCRMMFCLA